MMRVEPKMAATPFPPLEPGSFLTLNPESHDVEHQGVSLDQKIQTMIRQDVLGTQLRRKKVKIR